MSIPKINRRGLDLIKCFEGLRTKAYRCQAGVLTIGYGHTSKAGLPNVSNNMTISEYQAEFILRQDLVKFEHAVAKALGDTIAFLTSNQFSACVSLCYNIGISGFTNSSVVKYIHQRELYNAAGSFKLWNKAGGKVSNGLVRRRAAECNLFLKGYEI
jgi:lysozyme